MATVPNPYNVALSIFRNREWVQPFAVQNNGVNIDISKDSLRLVVLQGPSIVLQNLAPTVSSGSATCTFVFIDGDTGKLTANENDYSWQFLRKPYLAINTDLLTSGPLTVLESPPFP
jgi:hypothetical protein